MCPFVKKIDTIVLSQYFNTCHNIMWASPYSSISWRERAQQRDATSKVECMRNVNDRSIICLDGDTSSKAAESNVGKKSEIIGKIPDEYIKCMSHPLNKGTMSSIKLWHALLSLRVNSHQMK